MESALIVTAVVAVTEFLKRVQAKDTYGAVTIVAAAAVGLLAGLLGVEGMDAATGLLVGLGAAGIHTVAKQIG